VGSKKPNDLGLFDVLGNMLTWCQEGYKAYPQGKEATDDKEDELVIVGTLGRMLRGGSFLHSAVYVRSAFRDSYLPSLRVDNVGVRPARTLPAGSIAALPPTPEGGRP
jgi:eukaryotic-like serine/threonine-protein kinase